MFSCGKIFAGYVYLILVCFFIIYKIVKIKPLQTRTGKIYATYTVFSV